MSHKPAAVPKPAQVTNIAVSAQLASAACPGNAAHRKLRLGAFMLHGSFSEQRSVYQRLATYYDSNNNHQPSSKMGVSMRLRNFPVTRDAPHAALIGFWHIAQLPASMKRLG